MIPALLLLVASCQKPEPQAPTAGEAQQLDEAEELLNGLGEKEGPEAEAPDPSNESN